MSSKFNHVAPTLGFHSFFKGWITSHCVYFYTSSDEGMLPNKLGSFVPVQNFVYINWKYIFVDMFASLCQAKLQRGVRQSKHSHLPQVLSSP